MTSVNRSLARDQHVLHSEVSGSDTRMHTQPATKLTHSLPSLLTLPCVLEWSCLHYPRHVGAPGLDFLQHNHIPSKLRSCLGGQSSNFLLPQHPEIRIQPRVFTTTTTTTTKTFAKPRQGKKRESSPHH
ncbi:hypothetical protein E2C01_097540 [Portunus trituberculatus]|uniref:Uncharacterized protein n=1 Tax=Portunus trituberculatus TaxID=210409 RepID=A0A5B7K534_PORTR|nr:hypothetical protein [Portunus trituberculatus]